MESTHGEVLPLEKLLAYKIAQNITIDGEDLELESFILSTGIVLLLLGHACCLNCILGF